MQLYPAKAATNLTGHVWELFSLRIYWSLNAFGQFLFLHLRDTITGCFFLDFSDSPSQVFSALFFSFHLESVAAFHVLTAIHLVACPLSPHGLTHHHGFSDHSLSKWPPFIASVLIAFHACWMLPHGWPTNPLTLSHLNQNLLVLPCTDSSFCFLSPLSVMWSLIPWFWQFFPNTLGPS